MLRLLPLLLLALLVAASDPSPFAPSRLETASGKKMDGDLFFAAADCGECHVDQARLWRGSAHSRSHHDAIYLAFAEMARKEGGEAFYRFCSGCHAPGAVASGEIPGQKPTFLTDEGVTCDVCHRVKEVASVHAGGGANASFLLDEGETRYGPIADPSPNPNHESVGLDLFRRAEFCSACHTLIHPTNGLVIENTYEEWRRGPYAKAGIVCQDCHMRTVEQAREVARTMKPVVVAGRTTADAPERPDVHAHLFVGGNTNARLVGLGSEHAAEAVRRLQSAVEMGVGARAEGAGLAITVELTNVGAGHAIPTSITELRQVWIDLSVTDGAGREIFRSGAVDAEGRVDPQAVMYHSVLADEKGVVTYLPWRAAKMVAEKLLHPKETARETYTAALPDGAKGPFRVRAVLRYRSAPQEVLDALFGKGTLPIETVDMASAETTVSAE